ncbi:glycoside hydrolase [Thraustotheca clavata]|uniref:Glycoside hydrolase n=1 Tax=Thraustotheca clavata TaxID=74557 RepID=A0A1W0AA62_9STRA|nr:glycoside hydrolase [Thraustotheca clavata]
MTWFKISFLLVVSVSIVNAASGLCSAVKPYSYSIAKKQYPHLKSAIEVVEKYPIATWYTDRDPDSKSQARLAVGNCTGENRPTIVVYGLPNKDCQGHQSSDGINKTPAQYIKFLTDLAGTVKDNHVVYIIEPDAIGLLVGGASCAVSFDYESNLIKAVSILGANPNADIYIDIGHWILGNNNDAKIATILNRLDPSGVRLKGISINTSNFRTTKELVGLCASFSNTAKKISNRTMTCVLDVSRNFMGPEANSQWCNPKGRGIGHPPTITTGEPLIDYFLWIKPPGESDGYCNGGPNAGEFYRDGFVDLWNNGYFVQVDGMNKVSA